MSVRRASDSRADAPTGDQAEPPSAPAAPNGAGAPSGQPPSPPRSLEEAEARYITARDAWTAAMRRANSGRSADLASLAITQEAYELAVADVERWRSGSTAAIPIDPGAKRASLETAIGQEMAWRRVHASSLEKRPGLLARLTRRLTGRG
ncbi:MAG: hypothetical protein M3153_06415 [Chloroflexota bacterium]|nr:hypothetical protein [Chloroflexota bacterium]